MMNDKYTVIYYDYFMYEEFKNSIKKIMDKYGFKFNSLKMKKIKWDEVCDIYRTYHLDDEIDAINFSRSSCSGSWSGVSGMWESSRYGVIKGIKISVDDDNSIGGGSGSSDSSGSSGNDELPFLMIHKGDNESIFYTEFIKYVIWKVGSLVVVMVRDGDEFIEIMRKKINVKLLSEIEDKKKTIEIKTRSFIEKAKMMGLSSDFIDKWNMFIKNES